MPQTPPATNPVSQDEARKELRMIADEYYLEGAQEEEEDDDSGDLREEPSEEEDVSVLDRVLEVMMNCSHQALSPRLGYSSTSH